MRTAAILLVLVALAAGYSYGVGRRVVLTTGDDFAYASAAIDLAEGTSLVHHYESRALATRYIPIDGRPGAYASKYPLGLSLLLVPFYLVGGFAAMWALGPVTGVLSVVATYDVAWQLARRRDVALVAAALVATVPAVVMRAGTLMSDLPAMTLVTAAIAIYLRYLARPRAAIFCVFGLLSGAAFLVRNPSVLVVAVAGAHQLFLHGRRPRAHLAAWIAGALVFAAFAGAQLYGNLVTFGSIIGGYERDAFAHGSFSLAHVPRNLPKYLVVLSAVPPLGLPATLLVAWRRRGVTVWLAGLVLAFVAMYSAWSDLPFRPESWFVGGARFVLAAVPIGCVSLAIAAFELVTQARVRRVAIAVVLAAQLGASAYLAYQLRAFKERMVTHRERIRAATAEGALIAGPAEWSKLFFGRDGKTVRRYASYERFGEAVRLVEEEVRAGRPAYVLRSGRRETDDERRALAQIAARHPLVILVDERLPYELRVEEVLPAVR